MRNAAAAILLVLLSSPVIARWKDSYADAPPDVKAWYRRQTTTAETRKRLGATWYKFCCDDADTVEAKVDKRDGHWFYQLKNESEWRPVPDDTVQDSVMTPYGKPVLYVDATYLHAGPVCFFPGGSGS